MEVTLWVRQQGDDYEVVDCGTDVHSSEILSALEHLGGHSRLGISSEEVDSKFRIADETNTEVGPMLHWLAYEKGWCRISVSLTQNEFGVSASSEDLARVGISYLVQSGVVSEIARVDIDDEQANPLQSVILIDKAIDAFLRGSKLNRLTPKNTDMAQAKLEDALYGFSAASLKSRGH